MGLKSLLKKASITLGSILLACNIGCNSSSYSPNVDLQRSQPLEQENLEGKIVDSKSYELKMWQYYPPLNIIGGLLLRDFTHESSCAIVALAVGMEIEDYHPIRFIPSKYSDVSSAGCWVKITDESYGNASDDEIAACAIAGPISDILSSEIINYNLRNGNVPAGAQPFWATTSLVYRWCSLGNALFGLGKKHIETNDFNRFAEKTGISEETSFGVVALHTLLNAKRIKKEVSVALGEEMYPVNKRKSRVDLLPSKNGLNLSYTLNF